MSSSPKAAGRGPRAPAGSAIPAAYLRLGVELGSNWGLSEDDLLRGTRIPPALLHQRSARVPIEQASLLGLNLLRLSGRPGLGFELGLNVKLTSHGALGYAFLSAATLREAGELVVRYLRRYWSPLELRRFDDGTTTIFELVEHLPLGPFQRLVHEALLTMMWAHGCFVSGGDDGATEFCFPWSEPAYFAEYRSRLPTVHWSQTATAIRIATRSLDRPLLAADPLASQEALVQAEREMSALTETADGFAHRVRALLEVGNGRLPTLATVAARLCLSERSLKRRLQACGTTFQALLNEALEREACRRVLNPEQRLQDIATALGYQDPESFTRAFRRWTGVNPSDYRRQRLSAGTASVQRTSA